MKHTNIEFIPLPARLEEWDLSEGKIRVLNYQGESLLDEIQRPLARRTC